MSPFNYVSKVSWKFFVFSVVCKEVIFENIYLHGAAQLEGVNVELYRRIAYTYSYQHM